MPDFINSLPKIPDPALMKMWDEAAIKFGIPEILLMENAAQGVFDHIKNMCGNLAGDLFWIFAGPGNNGGDAICLARKLLDADAYPMIFHFSELENNDDKDENQTHELYELNAARWQLKMAKACEIPVIHIPLPEDDNNLTMAWLMLYLGGNIPHSPRMMIDGLIGAGLNGSLRPQMQKIIQALNDISDLLRSPFVSIDIPSGLNGITGNPQPVAISASFTVTLAAAKPGVVMPQAKPWTGETVVKPIGIPKAVESQCPSFFRLLDGSSILKKQYFPRNSHKNMFGHIYLIGGKCGMEGACHLACAGALRAGAGLVTALAPQNSLAGIKSDWPEIMTLPVAPGNQWPENIDAGISEKLDFANAIVIGPGMGRGKDSVNFLTNYLKLPLRPPTVIDADALMIMAQNPDLFEYLNENDVLTPHPGEAASLLKISSAQVQNDRTQALRKLIELAPSTFVLKGACTLIGQQGETHILVPYDIPQMAIAGSGDVLAGCISSFMAIQAINEYSSLEVAALGVIHHTMAGYILYKQFPDRGAIASQLADNIPDVGYFLYELAEKSDKTRTIPWP